MRDGSFCAFLVPAAEPSNTERTVPSVCDSHGSDFGCLSQTRLSVAYSPDENQQKVYFARNVVVSLQCQKETTTFLRHQLTVSLII